MNAEALTKLITAARKANQASEALSVLSPGRITLADEIFGFILDGLYIMCNEKSELTESIVYKLVRNADLSDEQAADMLIAVM